MQRLKLKTSNEKSKSSEYCPRPCGQVTGQRLEISSHKATNNNLEGYSRVKLTTERITCDQAFPRPCPLLGEESLVQFSVGSDVKKLD